MKLKVRELVASMESGALQRLTEMALPASTAFRLKPIVKQCNDRMGEFTETRNAVFERFKWDKKPGPQGVEQWFPPADNPEAVQSAIAELEKLVEEDIELTGQPIAAGSMFLSSTSFTVQDLMTLEWLIQEKPEPQQQQPKQAAA